MYPMRLVVPLCLLMALPACSAISALGDASTPLEAYDLSPVTTPVARRQSSRELVVEIPGANGGFVTDRIMMKPNRLQAQYLPGARWTEETPEMMQRLILHSLENAGAFRYVGRRPLGSSGDIALVSEITDFQAELDEGGRTATVRLRVTARLVREDDARVIASRSFVAVAPAASLDTLVVVEAFDSAAGSRLGDLTGWVLSALSVGARPA